MMLLRKIYTHLFGVHVGTDIFGNMYYRHRTIGKDGQEKRWVMFHGMEEASKVPAEWHGWLHYTHDAPFSSKPIYPWQRKHVPNLTGTMLAHRPRQHPLSPDRREGGILHYEPWKP